MEDLAEMSEPIDTLVDVTLLKRKENDEQLSQQSDVVNALENVAQVNSPRSPETFIQSLDERGLDFGEGSASDPGTVVEELTLNNYKHPTLLSGSGSSVKKDLWSNFTRRAGEQRGGNTALRDSLFVGDREGVKNPFMPHILTHRPSDSIQLEPSFSNVGGHLAESENRIASKSLLNRPKTSVREKIFPASVFSQSLVKNSLRGKGVAYKNQRVHKEPCDKEQSHSNVIRSIIDTQVDNNLSERPTGKADGKALFGGICQPFNAHHIELSLREWLEPRRHKSSKVERLHMFKQILKIVDTAHSQGLVLQHLLPSCFLISPSNHLKYTGSFVPKSQMDQLADVDQRANNYIERPSKRKKYWWHDKESSVKQQKLDDQSRMIPATVAVASGCRQSTLEPSKLEGKWYTCPKELNNRASTFYSNIYSLGVLFFELFCYFQSCEAHSAAMSDLRRRILPPCFLSESPKEAGFCLWLLHPEPSLRPSSRDVLLSDLIIEDHDLSFPDQSLALVDEEDAKADLLLHFLVNMKEEKEKKAAKLVADVECITTDIGEVEKRYSARTEYIFNFPVSSNEIPDRHTIGAPIHVEGTSRVSMSTVNEDRLIRDLDQLENAYFSMRSKIELSESNVVSRSDTDVLRLRNRSSRVPNDTHDRRDSTDSLGAFFEGLCKYAQYSKFELRGSLRSVDILNPANVICSLSFDRDEDYFAAAGVAKKIKIFEFGSLLNDTVDIHYPMIEMSSKSKLSCVSWNSYVKNYLASTDHEGVVQLWDASTGLGFTQYAEHQKRAWSVDFSVVDPTRMASGSDDYSVKLWSINERNCIGTIRTGANVCCVQFSPYSSHLLAFGSADYKTYCYDQRMTRTPWCTLAGHRKTVSYVKFVDSVTVASASTDNSLKLWDLNKTISNEMSSSACSMTFSGHTNEKNFVGLSVSDGYIVCGSETNEVYSYYRTLPMPITSYKFGSVDPITGQDTGDDSSQFVSSVCWRSRSNMVVAANSSGTIKLLQMV